MYQSLRTSPRLSMRGLVFAGGVCIMSYWLTRFLHNVIMRRCMAERRNRKREEKARAKKEFAAYLKKNPMPAEEIEEITAKPYMDLVDSLREGKLTPQKVLLAYQHKAFEVDQRCNCVIEFLHPDLSEINLKGPFAGAPISLKDTFYVKGCESYVGMAYYLTGPAQTDSVLVTILKSLGAVPFVRTNVPQSLLSVLSVNPIDGDTLNPLALDRSPGGSSSGEAALIAGGGSGLGIGTDLGGSIRLPAALCNIVGFKPTPERLSKLRMLDLRINSTIPVSCGPLAKDVKTCVAVMQSLCNSPLHHELDYFIPPLPFLAELPKKRRLRIGYFISDGFVTPVPAAQRAVLHVKLKLEALGHEVVPWQPPCPGSVWFLIYVTGAIYFESSDMAEALRFDATEPSLQARMKLYNSSWIVQWFYWLFGEKIASSEELTFLRAYWTGQSVPALVKHLNELAEFRLRLYDHWRESNLDGVICPAFGMAAPPPVRTVRKFSGMLSFLNLFNVCGMPAGCLPSGIHVEERDLAPLKASLSAKHKHTSHSQTEIPDVYPVNSAWQMTARDLQLSSLGFPVSVQVATAPWRDELCLHIMQEIESAVRNPDA